jgi:hypothetical protein
VGKKTHYKPLPDQAYDPRVTDLSKPLNVPGTTGPQANYPYQDPGTGQIVTNAGNGSGWVNRNVTNTIPFSLISGKSTRALPVNYKRTGVIIQNLDATQALNYSFANDLQGFGAQIGAGGAVLLDFTTPPDTLYLFTGGLANIQALVMEFSRAGG